jgi:hypothetical protein
MYERLAILFVHAFYLYISLGVAFAIAFVTIGVSRVDSQAIGSSLGFRILIFPGSVAFWPLLLRRWTGRKSEPPEERNPHR